MSKKRHHMTKHQYNAYKKQHHRQYWHMSDMEREEGVVSIKHGKKNDKNILKTLQNSQGTLEDFLNEEYDELSS